VKYETRIRELIEGLPSLVAIVERLRAAREKLRDEFAKLDRIVRDEAKQDPVCRRLTTVLGVGPIVSPPMWRRSTFLPASEHHAP
jgi:transposase